MRNWRLLPEKKILRSKLGTRTLFWKRADSEKEQELFPVLMHLAITGSILAGSYRREDVAIGDCNKRDLSRRPILIGTTTHLIGWIPTPPNVSFESGASFKEEYIFQKIL